MCDFDIDGFVNRLVFVHSPLLTPEIVEYLTFDVDSSHHPTRGVASFHVHDDDDDDTWPGVALPCNDEKSPRRSFAAT